jgi:hypothetical protein
MKKLLTLICFAGCMQATAQNKICSNLLDNNLHNVFVFSQNRNHTIKEVFGEMVPTMLFNIQYIPNEERKKEIDSMVLEGQMHGSAFIFPDKNAEAVVRFCTPEEYAAALRTGAELKIERQ